jgi:hypothetical protein
MCRLLFFRPPKIALQGAKLRDKCRYCLNIPRFDQMLSERTFFSKKVFD